MHKALSTRILVDEDLDKVVALQDVMLQDLPDPTWYYPSEREEFAREIKNGQVWGSFCGEELAAYAILTRAGLDPNGCYAEHMGNAAENTWDFQDIVVKPDYRRQGIHSMYLELFYGYVKQQGGTTIYCTVSPDNVPSWHSFEKAGYQRVDVRPAYDGRLRAYYMLRV